MTGHHDLRLSVEQVPAPAGAVGGCGEHVGAVVHGRHGRVRDGAAVPGQHAPAGPAGEVPDPRGAVLRGGDRVRAALEDGGGGEGDGAAVAGQHVPAGRVDEVPDPGGPVLGRGDRVQPAVEHRSGEEGDRQFVADQRVLALPPRHAPDLHGARAGAHERVRVALHHRGLGVAHALRECRPPIGHLTEARRGPEGDAPSVVNDAVRHSGGHHHGDTDLRAGALDRHRRRHHLGLGLDLGHRHDLRLTLNLGRHLRLGAVGHRVPGIRRGRRRPALQADAQVPQQRRADGGERAALGNGAAAQTGVGEPGGEVR